MVIAETYPAEAYGHVGVRFGHAESKTNQEHRQAKAAAIFSWADDRDVTFDPQVRERVNDGFGKERSGEDQFDALLGLLGIIDVADGRRAAQPDRTSDPWEGWIIGQAK